MSATTAVANGLPLPTSLAGVQVALDKVRVTIGGVDAQVSYAGAQGLAGLDQINVAIPRSLAGRGEVDVVLTVDGQIANTVRVNVNNHGESMTNRREFLKTSAMGVAATLLPQHRILGASSSVGSTSPLKKAVLVSMLPKELSYLDRFKLAVDAGFEGIEAQTILDAKEADEIKEASMKAKIPIHSVMNMGHWEWPLSSPNPEDVKKSVERMEVSLRNAKLWGAETVLLVPAVVRPDTTIPQAWERSKAPIKKLIPLAKELGVVIAIEEVWNKFLLTPYDHARYVDEFKSPWVKAYFDVGNIVMYGYPQEWIRALGKRIARFHLKDFDTRTRQFVNLREGSIDWKEVRKAIGEIGYSGWLTVELQGGNADYLRDVSLRVDKIFAGE